jgi:hypothetical protein
MAITSNEIKTTYAGQDTGLDSTNNSSNNNSSSYNYSKNYSSTGSLLAEDVRVSAPFIRVTIGGFTFGTYEYEKSMSKAGVSVAKIRYPAYVSKLVISKVNGAINQYELSLDYQITEYNDPNFFERILSSITQTRKIIFSYGDFMTPSHTYKDEEAIITAVSSSVDIKNSKISYTIKATSSVYLALNATFSFPAKTQVKPSDVIKEVVKNEKYGLVYVFTGMSNHPEMLDTWIEGDDCVCDIPAFPYVGAMDYINKLVSYMTPKGNADTTRGNVYTITTYTDTNVKYDGAYFRVHKIKKSTGDLNKLCTYTIDIGYPSANIITDFKVSTNDNWSILYEYYRKTNVDYDYVRRIDSDGHLNEIYSPLLANTDYKLDEPEKNWWKKVTEYPIQATLSIKGLLRPAILMTYLKVNVWFYGTKHIYSGYYIITAQEDMVDVSGYSTKLSLLRIQPDEEEIVRQATISGEVGDYYF